MPRNATSSLDESSLTKGQLRKLTALRKSLGAEIADRAFADWLKREPTTASDDTDRDAASIREAVEPLVLAGKVKIPRGGFLVRRGRGRVIVERPE